MNIEGFTDALARIVNDRRGASSSFQVRVDVQGHIAHKKQHPPRNLQQDYT